MCVNILHYSLNFFGDQGGEMLMHVVWDSHLLKPPLLKQQDHIQEKQRTINQRLWMKQYCLWGERKESLFHTPSRGPHQFPPPFQPKRKKGDMKKRGDSHQEQEKVNKGKNRRKLKENKIIKLN